MWHIPFWAHVCMGERVCLCMCTRMQTDFECLLSLSALFFETAPLSKPGAQWLMMLAGQWMLRIHLSLPLPITTQGLKSSMNSVFYVGPGTLNSGPHACGANTLLTETSSQSSNPDFKSASSDGGALSVMGLPFQWWDCPSGDGGATRVWEPLTSAIEHEWLLSKIHAKDEKRKPLAYH